MKALLVLASLGITLSAFAHDQEPGRKPASSRMEIAKEACRKNPCYKAVPKLTIAGKEYLFAADHGSDDHAISHEEFVDTEAVLQAVCVSFGWGDLADWTVESSKKDGLYFRAGAALQTSSTDKNGSGVLVSKDHAPKYISLITCAAKH